MDYYKKYAGFDIIVNSNVPEGLVLLLNGGPETIMVSDKTSKDIEDACNPISERNYDIG